MNRETLTRRVQDRANCTAALAQAAVEAILESIEDALQRGEDITISRFGSFVVSTRKASVMRNPRTGEQMSLPASRNVRFKAAKALKDSLAAAPVND